MASIDTNPGRHEVNAMQCASSMRSAAVAGWVSRDPHRQESNALITLNVNGKPRDVGVPDDMPLLWILRDVLGMTGTKFGCGKALCGACTIHIDGKPAHSCVTPASAAAGFRYDGLKQTNFSHRCGYSFLFTNA